MSAPIRRALAHGNARGGALGDTLAAVLNEAGYVCDKEYYINDAGNQVENLGKSVEARYFELLGRDDYQIPEDGYHGKDIIATAQRLLDEKGESLVDLPEAERRELMKNYALKEKVAGICGSLENFGVVFDNWFSEQSLHDAGSVHEVVDILREKGVVYEKDGRSVAARHRLGRGKGRGPGTLQRHANLFRCGHRLPSR